jgi:hypothetical protein
MHHNNHAMRTFPCWTVSVVFTGSTFSHYFNLRIKCAWPGQCAPKYYFNLLNAELNPIRHLLALVGAHHIVHVSGIRDTRVLAKRAVFIVYRITSAVFVKLPN